MSRNILAATFFAILSFPLLSGFANDDTVQSYAELDGNIVKAYNRNPKNTALVYVKSVRMLKKAEQDENTTGAAWRLKAQKLITVSCFYECTRAIDNKLYRQAYIWAQRGIRRGTTFGQIGDTPVNNLYSYLTFADSELRNTPMVKNSDPEELQRLIDDDNRTSFGPEPRLMTIFETLCKDIMLACLLNLESRELALW